MSIRIVIAAGGTGGHLFPALALALELSGRGCRVQVMGETTPFIRQEFTRARIPFHELSSPRLPSRVTGIPRFLSRFWRAFAMVFWRFCLRRPDGVVGMGGYASAPPAAAAVLLRCPLYLCEQNIRPGRVNRLFSRISRAVFTSFPDDKRGVKARRVKFTGNPLRPFSPMITGQAARQKMGLLPDRFTVLVLGGSQGAHRLNLAAREAVNGLAASSVQFIHLAGQNDLEAVCAWYRARGVVFFAAAFLSEMEQAYGAADLVLCRAGATTLAELAVFGRPAILVPYPYAAEAHQALNAAYLERRGAAVVIAQSDLCGRLLARRIMDLMKNPVRLAAMSRVSRQLARPEAAREISDYLFADISGSFSEKTSA